MTLPTCRLPIVSAWTKANVNPIQSTSVAADSSTSTVRASSPMSNMRTKGITTADEVPPRIAPSNIASSHPMPKHSPTTETMISDRKKQQSVNVIVLFHEERITLIESEVPPSNRMTTSVTATKTGPPMPRLSTFIRLKTGPSKSPMTISSNTSGIFFRL